MNTYTNTFIIFFTVGLILLIVGAILYAQLGAWYTDARALMQDAKQDSNIVLRNAGTAAMIVGGLMVLVLISVSVYVAFEIHRSPLLKDGLPKMIKYLMIVGCFFQLPAYIAFIWLHRRLKSMYFDLGDSRAPVNASQARILAAQSVVVPPQGATSPTGLIA